MNAPTRYGPLSGREKASIAHAALIATRLDVLRNPNESLANRVLALDFLQTAKGLTPVQVDSRKAYAPIVLAEIGTEGIKIQGTTYYARDGRVLTRLG